MDNQSVITYIKNATESGVSREDIYKELLAQGWSLENIEDAFDDVKSESKKGDVQKRTIRIVLIIGAVLIGAGIFSFVAANWRGIDKIFKILIILVAMLISHGAGWYLKENRGYKKTGEILILLGSIIFGSGIFLVGQIFNIRANWPDGFQLWMIGVLFMAYVVNSYPQYVLAIVLGVISLFSYPVLLFDYSFSTSLLASSFVLLITTVVIILIGLSVRKRMPEDLKKFY